LQVEILFTIKQGGNLCFVDVNIPIWQHFTKCTVNYVLNIRRPPTVSSTSAHNLRNNENYATPRSRLRMSMTSFIPSTVSLWNNLDLNIRNSPNISCIKYRIIKENTIKSPEYYSEGSRKLSILHARQRHPSMQLIEFWFISYKHYKWPQMSMWCTVWRFNSLSNGMSIIPKRKKLSF
jgi:hypothetical protein